MDPVAHTLFGAALAESGLKRRSRYATATLLIGANLPDVDALAGWWGRDVELWVRRGHTHGILAVLLWPLLLVGAVWLWHRWRGSRRTPAPDAPPFAPKALLALAYLAVASHPLLDWLNTYGVRLLMPFDGRWFYGDTLFIIDPWVWLLAAVGVVTVRSRSRVAAAGWLALGAAASLVVLGTDVASTDAKWAWLAALALTIVIVVLARRTQPQTQPSPAVARAGLAALAVYVGVAYGMARMAEAAATRLYPSAVAVQANPAPGLPHVHRVVVVEHDRYRLVTVDGTVHDVARQNSDAVVAAALAAPEVRGFVNWLRFPYWTVEEAPDYWTVQLRDLRYQGPHMVNARGIGAAQVQVPKADLR